MGQVKKTLDGRLAKPIRLAALGALALLAICLMWRQVFLALKMAVGGGVIAFLLEPLCARIEKKLSRPSASAVSLAIAFLVLTSALLLLIPPMIGQVGDLAERAPSVLKSVNGALASVNSWLESRALPQIPAPSFDAQALSGALARALGGTLGMAGSIAGGFALTVMTIALGYYFLADRDRMLLILELSIPKSARRIVLKMANSVKATIRLYLRAQVTIALIIGTISGASFFLIGLKNPVLLGVIVAVFNMIPYFGPILGGIPVTVSALTQGAGHDGDGAVHPVRRAAARRARDQPAHHGRRDGRASGGRPARHRDGRKSRRRCRNALRAANFDDNAHLPSSLGRKARISD